MTCHLILIKHFAEKMIPTFYMSAWGGGLTDEALYYPTIYPNSCDLGTAHASLAFGQLRREAGLRPNRILHCAAPLAAGSYDRPCGLIESLFLLSPARILDGRA